MCHDPFPGQNDKGQVPTGHLTWSLHRLLGVYTFPLRGAVPIGWIVSYVPYTQHMRGRYVPHHFKGQGHTGRSFVLLCALSSSTCGPLGKSMGERCVAHHLQIRGQGHTNRCKFCHVYSISLGLFHRFIVVSTPWLRAYLIGNWQLICASARSLDLLVYMWVVYTVNIMRNRRLPW